jgi:hypothetical protein
MIIGVTGHPNKRLGAGKTLLIVWLICSYLKRFPDYKVMTNFHLNTIPFTFLRHPSEVIDVEGAIIGIDDIYRWLAGRSNAIENFCKIATGESRKAENVVIYSSSIMKNYVKTILRDHTDEYYRVFHNDQTHEVNVEVFNNEIMPIANLTIPPLTIETLYGYYNTREKVAVIRNF